MNDLQRADGLQAGVLQPLIELADVSVRFSSVQALRNVTLKIARGESVALLGANGSGKTTLLRALHGVVAHGGRRQVCAHDVAGRALVQAMVYQRPFMLRLTVLNNLRLACWLAGLPRRQWAQQIDAALHRVGLAGLEGRPARALSGGQQQRLALARAWMIQPDILFLDEPTASLDPTAKREVEAVLAGFAGDGTALVMSTHNLGQAKRLARRIVYLEEGRVRADQPTAEFFAGAGRGALDEVEFFLKGEAKWDR
ncbi:ABC transporter ATP-binding protein [Piscinibacter sakaiensis]|uniref:ABC transporter ATP-binding protein n=1 Tax=Piscinibacter sakaiensis TaxID=1547922 RepID=UPI003AAE811E